MKNKPVLNLYLDKSAISYLRAVLDDHDERSTVEGILSVVEIPVDFDSRYKKLGISCIIKRKTDCPEDPCKGSTIAYGVVPTEQIHYNE